ncbi:hypothetical protein H310_04263 [Aphanomyces invadans]|uniref:Poly [ADP-ribose] polymerase n=1 Tax=Aphanomyces invadans TaxID=157072 RepID=A0A024UGH9_9STRA|nr:hypothetical protein H310_04263 [Aphanomyces invadans]ETW05310.1 hypothetical protein H310_04263 [Aphanomyces invadans]|eukprot:XP_008866748.1 hypothetical protein H310_04263 [Aphanomyces invadans]
MGGKRKVVETSPVAAAPRATKRSTRSSTVAAVNSTPPAPTPHSPPAKKAVKALKPVHATAQAPPPSLATGDVDAKASELLAGLSVSNFTLATNHAGDVMDASLVQIDLAKNTDKYYVLQLIAVGHGQTYYVFTRWGRTGQVGQHKLDGPFSYDDAQDNFCKKFLDKTGSNWADKGSFECKKGKYDLLVVDYMAAQASTGAVWEYYMGNFVDGKATGWYPYTAEGMAQTEALWQTFQANTTYSSRIVESGMYSYQVDLVNMTQTNMSTHKSRFIRRAHNGIVVAAAAAPSSGPPSIACGSSVPGHPPALPVIPIAVPATVIKSSLFTLPGVVPQPTPSKATSSVHPATSPVAKKALPPPVMAPPAAVHRPLDSIYEQLYGSNADVVDDYDVMLNEVAIKASSSHNKFYRIQLLDLRNGSWDVFTRWGRVGEDGNHALLGPFAALGDAATAFSKKFTDKTKNKWDDRATFVAKKNQYEIVELDMTASSAAHAPVAVVNDTIPSRLPKQTQKLICMIFDTDMFQSELKRMNLDPARMPLGTLSLQQIQKGVAILDELQANLTTPNATLRTTLSSKFYTLIPHAFSRSTIPPVLATPQQLEEKYDMLSTLHDIVVAQDVERAIHVPSVQQANSIDLKYAELQCQLDLVSPSDPVYSVVTKYIQHSSSGLLLQQHVALQDIWAVRRHAEDKSFASFAAVPNHRLLWHGTNVAVVAAILKSGLRIMPSAGGRVGKGIYLADMLAKSRQYVHPTQFDGTQTGCLFLVETALGDIHEITQDDPSLTKPPAPFDSVLAKGTTYPDPAHDQLVDFDGNHVRVPVGPTVTSHALATSFTHNEFLVYQERQQRLRFIVTFKM